MKPLIRILKAIVISILLFMLVSSCTTVHRDPVAGNDRNAPIEVSFVRETDDEIEYGLSQLEGETLVDNRWTRLYERELGIKIKYDWIVKGEDLYRQKLSVAVSSGDIPDIATVNSLQLKQLTDAGVIQDLTAIYEKYASPLTRKILSQEGSGPFDAATINNKLMALPEIDSSVERATFLWIRTDWLSSLGLRPPETMDDVLSIAEAFTANDPDKNGIDDTYGLALTKELWGYAMGLDGFMAGYHAYPNIWIENEEGKLVYGGILPEVKTALKALQDMYRAGHIDPDFAVKNGQTVAGYIADERIGMLYGEQWNAFYPIQGSWDQHRAEWQAYPIVSNLDEHPKVPLRFSTKNFVVVRQDFAHPEIVVKMFNLHLEKNWGETAEYETYYSTPLHGAAWKLSPITPFPVLKNLEAFRQLSYAREHGDISVLRDEAKAIKKKIDEFKNDRMEFWGWERTYGPDGAFAIMDMYDREDRFLYDKFVGAPTKTMIERKAMLDKLRDDTFVEIILGKPIDSFDQFVQNWRSLGGDAITAEVNEWYAKQKIR